MNVRNIEAYPGSGESMFSATGGMGPTATTVFQKLASMLAKKWSVNYMVTVYSGYNVGCVFLHCSLL